FRDASLTMGSGHLDSTRDSKQNQGRYMRPVMPLCATTPVSGPTTSSHPCSPHSSSTQCQVCTLFGCQIDLRTPHQPSTTENPTPSTSETSTSSHPSTTSGSTDAHAMAVDIDKDGYVDDHGLKVPSLLFIVCSCC